MRFGIVGTGFISGWFVDACRKVGATPSAVYSRDPERGRAFADAHRVPMVAESLEELAGSDSIDAIYVATPIASHAEQVAEALLGGKHVLCEKTLATSPDQVNDLFELALRQDRVLLESVRPTHDPSYYAIRNGIARIGTVRSAHFEKCQYSSRYPAFLGGEVLNALDPESGNSALRDIGVYCLHPALNLFGLPAWFTCVGYRLHNGFEAGGSLLLQYPDASVTCTYSKTSRSVTPSVIRGERGTVTIDSIAEPAHVTVTDLEGKQYDVLSGASKQPYETLHHPIAAFIELCSAGSTKHRYRDLSLTAEQIISVALGSQVEAPAWHRVTPCGAEAPTGRGSDQSGDLDMGARHE